MPNLQEKLLTDHSETRRELYALEEQKKMLLWRLQYIEALLSSIQAQANSSETTTNKNLNIIQHVPEPEGNIKISREDMTLSDVVATVLKTARRPLSSMNIARRAMAMGLCDPSLHIERVRSHFSAVISKDINSPSPRFWHIGRAAIGLLEWKNNAEYQKMAEFEILPD